VIMEGRALDPPSTAVNPYDTATGQMQQLASARQRAVTAAEQAAPDREELRRAAREFEALFLNFVLRSMRSTVPENELFNSNGPTKFYRQLHDQELAKAMVSGPQGLGIGDLIVRQFADHVPATGNADDPGDGSDGTDARALPLPVVPHAEAERRYQVQGATGQRLGRLAAMRRRVGALGASAADTLRSYQQDLLAASEKTGVDPALLFAVLLAESGGDPQAQSASGALGLMQLMPDTARELGVEYPLEPGANIEGGATYLSRMLDRFDSQLDLALAAYNAGPGAVAAAGDRIPEFTETQHYVAKVRDLYLRLTGADGTEFAR